MIEPKRLKHFDLLKVIAMLFVCFSHVYQRTVPDATKTIGFGVFYSVHMAIFMFVGGYFIKRCNSLLELGKYFLKLLALYIYPSVLFTVLTVISMERYASHDVSYWLNEFFIRTDTFYWYAISAVIINTLLAISFYLSNKISTKTSLKIDLFKNILTLVLFAVLFLPIIFIFKSKNPGMLASNLTVEFVPHAVVGFLFKSFGKHIKQTKSATIVELCVAVACLAGYIVALIHFRGWLNKPTDKLLFLHQLGSIMGVYVYYVLSKWLSKIKIFNGITSYAKYSFPLYLVHVYLIRVITPYVSRITAVDFYTVSFVVIYALVFTLGSLIITKLLTKDKYVNLLLFGDYRTFLKR